MKTGLLYGAPFVLAFVLVTGFLIFLNTTYQNIFKFDFSPKSNSHLTIDSVKTDKNDSLKTVLSEERLKNLDSLKTDSAFTNNINDSIRVDANGDINSKITDQTDKKSMTENNVKKNPESVTETKSVKLDPVKSNAVKQITNDNKVLRDTAYISWIKNVTSIYEAMEPKKAAKIIQNYSDNVARDILYSMKKKTAAKIVAELNPEIANRIFRFE